MVFGVATRLLDSAELLALLKFTPKLGHRLSCHPSENYLGQAT
jgi:hypothetical protein